MSSIRILNTGITNLETEVIVNSANNGLRADAGVSGAVFAAAGNTQLQAACREIGYCETGKAVFTPGYNLRSKYIIHAVGPKWRGGGDGEPQLLYSAYWQSLELAAAHDWHTIGVPLISVGISGYPPEKAWQMALRACLDYQKIYPEKDMDIVFAVIDTRLQFMGQRVLRAMMKDQEKSEQLLTGGRVQDALYFNLPYEANGYLSNGYMASFELDGQTFSSVTQYMMYRKCMCFGDRNSARKVMETEDPAQQLQTGSSVAGFEETVWDGMRQTIACRGIMAKFMQNEQLKRQLLCTGNAYLVMSDREDLVWSCGCAAESAERFDMKCWPGRNLLGFTLMEVREALRHLK